MIGKSIFTSGSISAMPFEVLDWIDLTMIAAYITARKFYPPLSIEKPRGKRQYLSHTVAIDFSHKSAINKTHYPNF
jgi:hypothetical protein